MTGKIKVCAKALYKNIKEQPLMSKLAFIAAIVGLIKAFWG